MLYLLGNEVIRKIPAYRKTLVTKLRELRYLDDRPVFEDDRRNAEAYCRGGVEAEREERALITAEKRAENEKRHNDFKEMMRRAKIERAAELARLAEEKE